MWTISLMVGWLLEGFWSAGIDWTQRSAGRAPLLQEDGRAANLPPESGKNSPEQSLEKLNGVPGSHRCCCCRRRGSAAANLPPESRKKSLELQSPESRNLPSPSDHTLQEERALTLSGTLLLTCHQSLEKICRGGRYLCQVPQPGRVRKTHQNMGCKVGLPLVRYVNQSP